MVMMMMTLRRGERAHDDIILAVRELGEFYKANGSRKQLSAEDSRFVMHHAPFSHMSKVHLR